MPIGPQPPGPAGSWRTVASFPAHAAPELRLFPGRLYRCRVTLPLTLPAAFGSFVRAALSLTPMARYVRTVGQSGPTLEIVFTGPPRPYLRGGY